MIKIGKVIISKNVKPKLISEISGNHDGKLDLAIKLIKKSAKNGSDIIKLQTYEADSLTLNCNRRDFIINENKSIWKKQSLYKLYKKGETKKHWHKIIFDECKKLNIECFSSIFDEKDIEFLENLKTPAYKISSFESNHLPLIEKLILTKKPILISTGLDSLKNLNELKALFIKKNYNKYSFLKCTSLYPARLEYLNLITIKDMIKRFDCEIGYSDHSVGYTAGMGAVYFGASYIEKHVCLNNTTGIDSKFSHKVDDLKNFKNLLEEAFESKGEITYKKNKDERLNLKYKRSIYAVKRIKKGDKFSNLNVRIIRPGFGLEPKYLKKIIGKKSNGSIQFGHPIQKKHYIK
jgi:N-acetylneuraminate synthase